MSRLRSRLTASAGLVLALAAGGIAIAEIATRQAAPEPQLSLNVAVPVFQVAGLVPGDRMTRCIRARNEGGEAIILSQGIAVTGDLAQHLLVRVERGIGLPDVGGVGSCTGFVPAVPAQYAFATQAAGVAPSALRPEYDVKWAPQATKSFRITIALPAEAPNAAMAKSGAVTVAFVGDPIPAAGPGGTDTTPTTPELPGGIAPGTTGGIDINGNFLSNSQIKKKLRIGKARLLKNGDVVVMMYLPAGGAIRAKVILSGNRYYAHTLLPEEWGPNLRVVLKRRDLGRREVSKYRRSNRRLVARVTTRYRWAHGPNAFVQPEQKLVLVRGR